MRFLQRISLLGAASTSAALQRKKWKDRGLVSMFPSKNGEEKAQSSFRSNMNYINHLGIEAKHIISFLFTFRFTLKRMLRCLLN